MDDNAAFFRLLESLRIGVDDRLAALAPAETEPPCELSGAVRYALLAPGKRFRPMLTLLSARTFGADEAVALDAACAFEMVHAASLILDDLPSMDDAGLRRGRQTTHLAFGEATAILAAVGLLNHAFGAIAADPGLTPAVRAALTHRLSGAVGFSGLVAGQARDLIRRDVARPAEELDLINHQKTGVLIVAAAEAGALIAGAPEPAIVAAGEYARRVGLAFQIRDDILDAEGGEQGLKDAGKDAGMTTIVSSLGVSGARRRMEDEMEAADAALSAVGAAGVMPRYVRALFDGRKAAA